MKNAAQQLSLVLLFLLGVSSLSAASTLVPKGAVWKYLDTGASAPSGWTTAAFDDSTWKSGPAELGYGDATEGRPEATVVSYGPDANNKYITTYFRQLFTVADPTTFTGLKLNLLRDDGAVVYLNGVEVYRGNLPGGTISRSTLATTAIGGVDETIYITTDLPLSSLVAGENVIAVEIHQSAASSSDLSFDLELLGTDGLPQVTREPYLQVGTATSLIVRWRTDINADSLVRFGTDPSNLTGVAQDASSTKEHEVQLSGLSPDTKYYYSIGSSAATFRSGADFFFVTAPAPGTALPTRIWVIGDAGTGTTNQYNVRNAYYNFDPARYTDVWLLLGDNVYETGTDFEYQTRHFEVYSEIMRNTVTWPTIGNHDTAGSQSPPADIPYYKNFTLPTQGEAGGVASLTEDYYSFDFGQIHFICLDSMTSSRQPGSPMLQWLTNDLQQVTAKWLVVFFHHPPYSKGHDSDVEPIQIEMRENVLPVLEQYGVDLVLCGHSHAYERSFLLDGHYGHSSTLTSAMIKDASSGRENETGPLRKNSAGLAANEGALYVVAGSSGKKNDYPALNSPDTDHPAMFLSLNRLGSLVVDIDGNKMQVRFLRENGAIDDFFTLVKGPDNLPPTVALTAPISGSSINEGEIVRLQAAASDDGSIQEVKFYVDAALVGSATTEPYTFDWTAGPVGGRSLTAVAVDNLGASTVSEPVSVQVNPTSVPSAPASLTAVTLSASAIRLDWSDVASESAYVIERLEGEQFVQIGTAGENQTSYLDANLQPNTAYAYQVRAANIVGRSEPSVTANATTFPPAPPSPAGFLATATSVSEIQLTWSDVSDETGFLLERSLDAQNWQNPSVVSLPADTTSFLDEQLQPATTYYYRLTATNAGGASPGVGAEATTATPVPAQVTGLIATPGNQSVTLAWQAAPNATSYVIRRASATEPLSEIASGVTVLSFVDSLVQTGVAYSYTVAGVNQVGEGAQSSAATATPFGPPTAPTGLVQISSTSSSIELRWADTSSDETSFAVERSSNGGGSFAVIATLPANSTSFNNTGLTANTTYLYRIVARNAYGSATSSSISATSGPIAPNNLAAKAASRTQINLTWRDNSANESGFRVELSRDNISFSEIASVGPNVKSFAVTGLTANTTYYFRVRAFTPVATSSYSNTSFAKTAR